jgi:hypothetical protein
MKFHLIFIITLQIIFISFARAANHLEDTDPILKQLNKQFATPITTPKENLTKAKIDIESLGLDKIDDKDLSSNKEVDKKDVIQGNIENISPNSKENKIPQKATVDNSKKVEVQESKSVNIFPNDKNVALPDKKNEEVKKESNIDNKPVENPIVGGTISKIQNFVSDSNKTQTSKKNKSKIKITKNEKKQKEKLSELNNLRKKYLVKNDSKKSNNYDYVSNQDLPSDNIKIIPKRRETRNFSVYETPAPPIFDKYRTKENAHIPQIITKEEKIGMLFEIVTNSNNTSYFKSAYDQIGDPNIKNASGDTLLTYAILLQKHSMIGSILSSGANPNLPNSLGYTPLGIVIEIGDATSLKMLMDNNVDVNYIDAFGRNYLMHAARVGFLQAVEILVSKGIDVNAVDNDDFTALSIAYRHKKDIIAKFLLKHGAKAWLEKPYDASSQSLIKDLNDRWKN